MTLDDAAIERLVGEARAGDAWAFGELFDHFHLPVYRYVASRVRHPSDAEDLTQLVFVKALEVNTSGLRYTIKAAFPHPSIVSRFRELGGRAVTVGSDAHSAQSANWGLADGYGIIADAGFEALTFRRAPSNSRVTVPF